MDNFGIRMLVVSVAASFAAGFGMAWFLKPDAGSAEAPLPVIAAAETAGSGTVVARPAMSAPTASAAPQAPPAATASVDELWSTALLPPDRQQAGYAAEDRLRQLAQSDPIVRRKLLLRYDSARTPQERELLRAVLSTVQTPDVIAFASRLAGSLDVADRKYGLAMLQSLAPDAPETRALVRQALSSGETAEVLVSALAALNATGSDPDEAGAVIAQLKSLSQHADPAVRSMSITQLSQWDKAGAHAASLTDALADRAPEVRQAAVFAIAQSGLRSEPAKAALMALAANAQESRDVRGSALQVLERFPLSREEVALVAQARARIKM